METMADAGPPTGMIPARTSFTGKAGTLLRRLAAGGLTLAVTACAGGNLSLTEYATQTEELVNTMNATIDRLNARLDTSTIEGMQTYFEQRAAARAAFLTAFSELQPPERITDLHRAALEIVTDLEDAEAALAQRAGSATTIEDLAGLLETPEGMALQEIDERSIEICRAAQAEADATRTAGALSETPWVPDELKEVVVVAFRCTAGERAVP